MSRIHSPRPRSQDTRKALVDAAARVFVERGFHGATVREIADAAGFTNPVLHYHFGCKSELYEAAIRAAFEEFERLVEDFLARACDPPGKLRAIASAHLRFGIEDPIRLRLLYAELFRPRGTDPDQGFDELRAWSNGKLEEVLREGEESGAFEIEDVPLAGRIFASLLRGLLVEQARDTKTRLLDESLSDFVVDAFLHGVSHSGVPR